MTSTTSTLRLQSAAPALLFAFLSTALCRQALEPGRILGFFTGEAWGRSFVTRQLLRWLTAKAPFGTADLINAPDGQRLWPIDPALQLIQLPAEALLGAGQGLAVAAVFVLFFSGYATHRLCRTLGAPESSSTSAGLVVMVAPYLLRNLQDAVLEATAVGFIAFAIEQMVRVHHTPAPRRRWAATGGAVLLLAGVSPYYTVYLALGCAVLAGLTWRRWRVWAGIAGVSALACLLALGPLLWAEAGDNGRFLIQGYELVPGPLVYPGSDVPIRRPMPGLSPVEMPPWRTVIHRIPGGAAVMAATVLGLILPGGRRWALGGAVFFLAGPGVTASMRAAGGMNVPMVSPLQSLLGALPLTDTLGNPDRVFAGWILLVAVGASLAGRGRLRWLLAAIGAFAVFEAHLTFPGLLAPSTPVSVEPAVLDALKGPTVVFPSGDFGIFHPKVAPKEALFLAASAEVAVAADYGRLRVPADHGIQMALSAAAHVVVSARAPDLSADRAATFRSVLLLEDRLKPSSRTKARQWLQDQGGVEVASGETMSAWRVSLSGPVSGSAQ
ncbi:MAG: hypothetical protein AAFV53_30755 [Myxococcota bacterium]